MRRPAPLTLEDSTIRATRLALDLFHPWSHARVHDDLHWLGLLQQVYLNSSTHCVFAKHKKVMRILLTLYSPGNDTIATVRTALHKIDAVNQSRLYLFETAEWRL